MKNSKLKNAFLLLSVTALYQVSHASEDEVVIIDSQESNIVNTLQTDYETHTVLTTQYSIKIEDEDAGEKLKLADEKSLMQRNTLKYARPCTTDMIDHNALELNTQTDLDTQSEQ